MKNKNTSLIGFSMIGVAAIPLVVYPVVLMANIMSLAGSKEPDASYLYLFSASLFVLATTVYPITIIVSFLFFWKKHNIKFAYLPYIHLLLILLAFPTLDSK